MYVSDIVHIKDDADGPACFGGVSPRKPRPYNFPESQINLTLILAAI